MRVTIPVDLYSGSITIKVEGVQVQIRLSSGSSHPDVQKGKLLIKPDVELIPNTTDLAQSFLETQPLTEKKKLEEAISAEAKDLNASISPSESDEDDEHTAYGTGQALTLPTFVADFLQGIADRIQVSIRSVILQLDVETSVEPSSSIPDLVTFEISLESIDVEGVTALANKEADGLLCREGKRRVSLNSIRAFLISEANVFTLFARSSSQSSLSAQSPSPTEGSYPSRESSDLAAKVAEVASQGSCRSEPDPCTVHDSEEALNIPYDYDALGSDPEDDCLSSPSTPRASTYQQKRLRAPAQSSVVDRVQPWASLHEGATSEPSLRHHTGEMGGLEWTTFEPPSQPASEILGEDSAADLDELSMSRLFSHEEAQSMYMSAFSHMNSSGGIPGAWTQDESQVMPEFVTRPRQSITEATGGEPADTAMGEQRSSRKETSPVRFPESSALEARDGSLGGLCKSSKAPTGAVKGPNDEEATDARDEAPTPKRATRLVKEIMSLKSISLYLPSNHKKIEFSEPTTEPCIGDKSISPHIPGAFSVHAASIDAGVPDLKKLGSMVHKVWAMTGGSVEIELSPLELQLDASIGFVLAKAIAEVLAAVNPPFKSHNKPSISLDTGKNVSTIPDIKILAEKVSLHFLESLPGVSDTAERILASSYESLGTAPLISTHISGLGITVAQRDGAFNTDVDLETFTLGYLDESILSFDRSLQLQASSRDALPTAGHDVSIRVTRVGETTKCEVITLPLLANLDLIKLDETFSWFGGVSSFLNTGASITSNTPPTTKAAPKSATRRSVQFEASEEGVEELTKLKVDMRIGGFNLHIIGKDCSIVAKSSAIKLIARDSHVGVGITTIKLDGPYKPGQMPPAAILWTGLRLDYLPQPQDGDLERLLNLITPSKFKFDSDYDEIMVDPLLRQRRKGPVLRLDLDTCTANIKNLVHLDCLPSLADDLARLATVAKYLPEDDRPGLLTFAKVNRVSSTIDCAGRIGVFHGAMENAEVAHISLPMLLALGVGHVSVIRNSTEELVGPSNTAATEAATAHSPEIMLRYIGSEIDPVVKIKLRDVRVEYRVPTIMDLLNLSSDATPQDFEAAMAQSVANLGDQAHIAMAGKGKLPMATRDHDKGSRKRMKIDVTFRDCLVGLNPLRTSSRMILALTDAHLAIFLPKDNDMRAELDVVKASVVLIDDIAMLGQAEEPQTTRRRTSDAASPQIAQLCKQGYVSILYTSSAKLIVSVTGLESTDKSVVVDVRDDLLVMETCADSTQTLITLINSLSPPTPPSKEVKFRTTIPIVTNLLASISCEAFGKAEGEYDFETDFGQNLELLGSTDCPPGTESPLNVQSQYLGEEPEEPEAVTVFDADSSNHSDCTSAKETNDGVLLSLGEPERMPESASDSGSELVVQDQYFEPTPDAEGTTHKWDSIRNAYDLVNMKKPQPSQVKIRVRDLHAIWNLYDGYDWKRTRDVVTEAVEKAEAQVFHGHGRPRQAQPRASAGEDDLYEEEEGIEVGDMLFNSIYVAIPSGKNPTEVAEAINLQLGYSPTDTESIAGTSTTTSTARPGGSSRTRFPRKKLRLGRSKTHKITFELQGVSADIRTFPQGSGETQSSVDLRVSDLTIYDHVPTSTWKKFATYNRDAGQKEIGTHMVHVELLNVKPVPDLAATEIVLKVRVLPLRLHVDQDALEFITRFFEFKDDSIPVHASDSDVPFIQRIEVASIPVKLDFKPKRVDYLALRSGRTTELMNFIVLDQSTLVLRRIILYGISGFDRMGRTLNELWTADVKSHQLQGVLAGLAPARPLVNVGDGFKDLVTVPVKEYRKDGRLVRGVQKGAAAFVRKTGTEVIKLGAKLAIGTQAALQGVEDLLMGRDPEKFYAWVADYDGLDEGVKKQISLYANQPENVAQGISRAYTSLSRDMAIAKDAIIAIPTDVARSTSAAGAAKAILGKAPLVLFRPSIGATKAIGQTLLGATNAMDKDNSRRAEDVSAAQAKSVGAVVD